MDPLLGTETYTRVRAGEKLQIGESGIDTVYVTVSMEDMTAALKEFKIGVAGREKALSIYFYLPQITFIEKIPEEGENAKAVAGMSPQADGSYDEYWVGSVYDLYLAIVRPNPDGTYSPCVEECNGLTIHAGVGDGNTSPGINFIPEETMFVNGYATVSVRSLKAYRWDTDPSINNPAKIVAEYNDFLQAEYSPIYFRNPAVPYPIFADVFDVRGSVPAEEYNIPAPYFDMNQEYLDGIADSVAIYFDRPIHKDSLPAKVCILWDSTVAEIHNPVSEGFSNIQKDTEIACNALVNVKSQNVDCSSADQTNGLCSNVITIGGLKLSEKVKTSGVGKVYAYSVFEDKGKSVKQGFAAALTDRIAPVPLRAELHSMAFDGNLQYDSLVVVMSEPVNLTSSSNKKSALDYYLNSATDMTEENRYASALAGTSVVVTAVTEPVTSMNAKTGEGRIKYIFKSGSTSPHVGDYVRLAGDLANVIWSDEVELTDDRDGSNRSTADASYYWNSPTGYDETKRLPSRWIPITGGVVDVESPNIEFADPSFRVVMTGPFQFTIVMDESVAAVKRNYAVMDLQGRVVRQGEITSVETAVPVLTSGSYVVKVGIGMRRVNVR